MRGRVQVAAALGVGAVLTAVVVGAASGGAPSTVTALPLVEPLASPTGTAYPGTVATSVSIEGSSRVPSGDRQELRIEIRTAGDARPRGEVTVLYNRRGGDYRQQQVAFYNGQPLTLRSAPMGKPGRYDVTVRFHSAENTVWQDSAGEYDFQVVGEGP